MTKRKAEGARLWVAGYLEGEPTPIPGVQMHCFAVRASNLYVAVMLCRFEITPKTVRILGDLSPIQIARRRFRIGHEWNAFCRLHHARATFEDSRAALHGAFLDQVGLEGPRVWTWFS